MIKDNGNGCYSGTIGKKTAVSIGLVIVIVMAALYIAGTVNAQNTKISLTEQEVSELKEEIVPREEFNVHIKSIDKRLEGLEDGVKRIEDKIDDLK